MKRKLKTIENITLQNNMHWLILFMIAKSIYAHIAKHKKEGKVMHKKYKTLVISG